MKENPNTSLNIVVEGGEPKGGLQRMRGAGTTAYRPSKPRTTKQFACSNYKRRKNHRDGHERATPGEKGQRIRLPLSQRRKKNQVKRKVQRSERKLIAQRNSRLPEKPLRENER